MRLPFPAPPGLEPQPVPADRLPQPCAREGAWAPNEELRRATRLFEGKVVGSESVAVAPDGTLWMFDKWGHAWTAVADAAAAGGYRLSPEAPVAYVGPGRPLGFEFDAAGNLLICDSKGLLMLERAAGGSSGGGGGSSGGGYRLRCLVNEAAGRPVCYANDLDVSPSTGRIYFTDSTCIPPALNTTSPRPWFDTMRSYMLTMAHGAPTGRLLAHDPATNATEVLQEGLWFANGVALAADESFVAVVETCSMRVRRRWLTGPKQGTLDTLIDSLPGWPDNISRASDGNFWLCLVLPDLPLAHRLMRSPWLRGLVANLPDCKKPQWGCIAKISPEGQVLRVLMDPEGSRVSHTSSCTEHAGRLFVGNLGKDYVSVLDLAVPPEQQQQQEGTGTAAAGTAK